MQTSVALQNAASVLQLVYLLMTGHRIATQRSKPRSRAEPAPSSIIVRLSIQTTEPDMAGLRKNDPVPTEIKLHQRSRIMEVAFDDGQRFEFTYEFLRVHSPSAEVRGHGAGQEVLQLGKRDVDITRVEPVGNYAIRPVFSDGHDSGLYSWDYLYDIGERQEDLWQPSLPRLAAEGGSRDPAPAPKAGGCGHSH